MKKILAFIFIFVFIAAGCVSKPTAPAPAATTDTPAAIPSKTVQLYFGDKTGSLAVEPRQIVLAQGESLEKRIVEELIKGPGTQNLSPTIPVQTKVISVNVQNGTAIVDLSQEFITKSSGGSLAEELEIYSVVNTLTDLLNVDKVQFLIDGKTRKVFNHMELEGDFERDDTMVKSI